MRKKSERFFWGLGSRGFHRVAYTQWGNSHNKRTLICVHGLTRNSRDFNTLARALSDHWHILCPDMVGRGSSDWLTDTTEYTQAQYINDCVSLIARSGALKTVDWIGTSMGGIIGMLLAAQSNSLIHRLVLNDVGAFVSKTALERIRDYVSNDLPIFTGLLAAEAYLGQISTSFGYYGNEQWQRMIYSITRMHSENGYSLNYDPGITMALRTDVLADVSLWTVWEAVRCPVLILRGSMSDVLTAKTVDRMRLRDPTTVIEIPDCGHAPTLMGDNQIKQVRNFLEQP